MGGADEPPVQVRVLQPTHDSRVSLDGDRALHRLESSRKTPPGPTATWSMFPWEAARSWKMCQPWDSSSRRLRPVHCSPTAPSCHFSIQCGGDMRAITNIATTMPVTSPALQRKLLHRAPARLAPMTKGARKAARTRKRLRFRRSQACVNSLYILAALSPAFLDLRACNMPTSMSSMRMLRGRNSQFGAEHASRGGVLGAWGAPGSVRLASADGGCRWGIGTEVVAGQEFLLSRACRLGCL